MSSQRDTRPPKVPYKTSFVLGCDRRKGSEFVIYLRDDAAAGNFLSARWHEEAPDRIVPGLPVSRPQLLPHVAEVVYQGYRIGLQHLLC